MAKRRDVLKILGLGSITTAIAPAVLISACKEAAANAETITYSTLNSLQVATVKAIQDAILPKTDTPSASEVGSVAFLDTFITFAYKPKQRERMLYQIDKFAAALQEKHQVDAQNASPEQIGDMLDNYYVKYEAPEQEVEMEIEGNKISNSSEESDVIEYKADPIEINTLLKDLRWLTLESYFQSEKIATEYLNYLPVPGKFIGDMPISELPNGMNWSL